MKSSMSISRKLVYRFYQPDVTDHLFSSDVAALFPLTPPWILEAMPFFVWERSDDNVLVPVHRFFSKNKQDHYYSLNQTPPSTYVNEGLLGYISSAENVGLVPLFLARHVNQNDTILTCNPSNVISLSGGHGWKLESFLGYVQPYYEGGDGTVAWVAKLAGDQYRPVVENRI